MATAPGRKSNPDPTPGLEPNTTTQNVFTIIVEHYTTVDEMSRSVRDIVAALPSVNRCAILLPTFPEREIAMNTGVGIPQKIMP